MLRFSVKIAFDYKTILALFLIISHAIFIGSGENSSKLDFWERFIATISGLAFIVPFAILVFPIVVSLLFFTSLPIILWIPITALVTVTIDYGFGATHWFIDAEVKGLTDLPRLKNTILDQVSAYIAIHILHRRDILDTLANVQPEARRKPATQLNLETQNPSTDTILDRIPENKWGTVLEVSVDGRYSRVRTTMGDHILRLPLKQAVREVDASSGLLVHRSIWLNQNEINRLFFEGGNPRVLLVDGTTRPVSRSKTDQIRSILRSD